MRTIDWKVKSAVDELRGWCELTRTDRAGLRMNIGCGRLGDLDAKLG
jgi:hypothetical protein